MRKQEEKNRHRGHVQVKKGLHTVGRATFEPVEAGYMSRSMAKWKAKHSRHKRLADHISGLAKD